MHDRAGQVKQRRSLRWIVVPALAALPMGAVQAQGGDAAGGAAGGSSGSGAVAATPLTVDYSLSGRMEYVDNIGFSDRSTFITRVGPSVTLRSDSETFKLSGTASLSSVHFSNSAAGRSRTTEPRYAVAAQWLRPRTSFGIRSTYYRSDNFRGNETEEVNGFRLSDARRTFFTISPNFGYSITERLSFNANYGFSDISYSPSAPGLVDIQSQSVGSGLQYRLTELDSIGTSLSATRFRTSPETTASDTRSIQVSWNRTWSERTFSTLYLGVTESDVRSRRTQQVCLLPIIFCQTGLFPFETVQFASETKKTTPSYGFTFATQLDERTTLGAQGNRGVQAGGGGTLIERESWSADLAHRFTERLRANIDYTWSSVSLVGTVGPSRSNQLQVLAIGFGYSLPDNWSFGGGARIAQTSLDTRSPQSRAVFVTLSKTWPNNRLWP